jgi:hypothetical protein
VDQYDLIVARGFDAHARSIGNSARLTGFAAKVIFHVREAD